jgi:tetratricopeptide (TPR) repeat protein
MDALVQRLPNDYRPYIFRGLYHGFFVFFADETKKQDELKRAFDDLNRAAKVNPTSPLQIFLKAEIFERTYLLQMMNIYNPQHDELNNTMIALLNAVLSIDKNSVEALQLRASAFSHLKMWRQEIADWNRVLTLDPKNFAAYNDRAAAKLELGDTYEAISDFSDAIKNRKRELMHSENYEGRAEAYLRSQQWDLAIRDLTTAISLKIGGLVLLMPIDQFRAIYPEYRAASNEVIVRKLNQTFYPDMKYEGFAKSLLSERRFWPDAVIPDLYVKRSDAYLRKGDWHRASIEFRRASNGFPDYASAIDRWRELEQTSDETIYIDMRTFDDSHIDAMKIWIKELRAPRSHAKSKESLSQDGGGPHELTQYELNCIAWQLRTVSSVLYDASGNVIGHRAGSGWNIVVPDSLGETLYNGACKQN